METICIIPFVKSAYTYNHVGPTSEVRCHLLYYFDEKDEEEDSYGSSGEAEG